MGWASAACAGGSAAEAVELLAAHHPGATVIGHTTAEAGVVELPDGGLWDAADGGLVPAG